MGVRRWRQRVWHPVRVRAWLGRITPYDCRHTFALLLIHEGRNALEVSRMMRNAKPDVTLRVYAHEFAEWDLREKVPIADAVAEQEPRSRRTGWREDC